MGESYGLVWFGRRDGEVAISEVKWRLLLTHC